LPAVEFIFNSWQIHFYQLLKMNSTAGNRFFDGNIIVPTSKRKNNSTKTLQFDCMIYITIFALK